MHASFEAIALRSLRSKIERFLNRSWYSNRSWTTVLAPLSWVYGVLVKRRRNRYLQGKLLSWRSPVPVCVVGNLTLGGTGKTPLVVWLARWLYMRNLRVGIVSRGYGGSADYPLEVLPDTSFRLAGDEAVLLARRTKCPVVVDPDRAKAVQKLIELHDVDVVLSDDGLQHYGMDRSFEVAVLDGARKIGNGRLLPSGPLREPVCRLKTVDWLVANSCKTDLLEDESVMEYQVAAIINVVDGTRLSIEEFQDRFGTNVNAVAGIGNPTRFEHTLLNANFTVDLTVYPDHHVFADSDFPNSSDGVIVVTEKDAQKICEVTTVAPRTWYVEIEVQFEEEIDDFLTEKLRLCGLTLDVVT